MPLCLLVCLSVRKKKILIKTSSGVAKAFKDTIHTEKQSTELYWNVSVPDTG